MLLETVVTSPVVAGLLPETRMGGTGVIVPVVTGLLLETVVTSLGLTEVPLLLLEARCLNLSGVAEM